MTKTGLLALMVSLALAAGASAQTKKDPRVPEVKKPDAQLTDPDSWKTQKEKDQEKQKNQDKSKDQDKTKDAKDATDSKDDKDSKDAAKSSGAKSSTATAAKRGGTPTGWQDRAYVSGNFGWQLGEHTFSDSKSLTDAGQVDPEKRQFTAKYKTEAGPTVDIGGAFRLVGGLGVGVAVTRYAKTNDITIDGSVPHPFFFNRPRAVSGVTDGTRNELGVHIDAVWVVPVNRRAQVAIFGGPTFFNVKQTVVNNFTFTQQYPYDEATFASATVDEESGSVTGFNVGADVGYYFTDVFGVGGMIRFSRGTFESGAGKVDVGGPEVGFGVRLRVPSSTKRPK